MPTYEYLCSCGEHFDCHQGFNDKKLTKCFCEKKKKVKRLISKPMIISDDVGRGVKRMTDRKLYKELDE